MCFDNELPVENVGDGEGTVVAGQVNEYLGLKHAVTCPVAMVYLIREFTKLDLGDQFGWLDAQEAGYLALSALLSSKIPQSLTGILAAIEAGVNPEDVDDYASAVNNFLEVGVELGDYTTDDLARMTMAALEETVAAQD